MYDPTHEYSQNVLVTGATGAIGRAVCRELVVTGYRVHGLVRDDVARARLPYAVIAVMGDIRRPEAWENAIRNADAVIHLAVPAEFNATGKLERVHATEQGATMAAILEKLGNLCRRQKKKFLYTFGSLMYEPDAQGWVRENSPISSGRGFGIRHRIVWPVYQELKKKGLKAISVNPSFVYGQGGWFESGVLEPMSQGRSLYLGDGTQTMHYVAASDAAAAYRLALEHGIVGEDYLIADDAPSTVGEFTRLVAREMGAPEPVSIPDEEAVAMMGAWAYEAYTFCPKVDSTRAREHLGWTPKYRTIQDGVPLVVREFKKRLAAPRIDWEAEARERFRRPAPL
jgi:nucleoside-diphosphate-sugar epimerase